MKQVFVPPFPLKKAFFSHEMQEYLRTTYKREAYRFRQIETAIFHQREIDFAAMTNLPKQMRDDLARECTIIPFHLVKCVEDEEVVKFLFAGDDGQVFETVLMYHRSTHHESKLNRMTLCISSQVWCAVWCTFCVTGTLGLRRNLTMPEILGQVLYVNHYIKMKRGKKENGSWHGIRNVVYMGMGEPLMNYPNVKASVPYLTSEVYLGLSRRRVTISTSWFPHAIKTMADDKLPVSFAFSLHASTQALREELVPFAKRFPLDELMRLCDYYTQTTGQEIFYEYVIIDAVNDSDQCAHDTGKLLKWRRAHLNVIPYNESPAVTYREPSPDRVRRFQMIVKSYGVMVTIRQNRGRKSKGACWQLGREQAKILVWKGGKR